MTSKKKLAIVVSVVVPSLLIIAILAIIYFPRLFAPMPRYNFVFLQSSNFFNRNRFQIIKGKIKLNQNQLPRWKESSPNKNKNTQFYIYDMKKNKITPIPWKKVQTISFTKHLTSPDGYRVEPAFIRGSGLLKFIIDRPYANNPIQLVGHGTTRSLNIPPNNKYHWFHFIGWIDE